MKKPYGNINGNENYIYTVGQGAVEADICNFGARINALRINGIDIVLGFNSSNDYVASGTYAGATIGRVANRIAGGRFALNGAEYSLNTNDGKNHLHGGSSGFDKKLFTVTEHTQNSVTMNYLSADGEENYSGNLDFTVKFTVKNNSLEIIFTAKSDNDTLWCPTNHAYFNLDGESSGDCRSNLLKINACYYTPSDGMLIPTGEKRAVKNTPFDFTAQKKIGSGFNAKELLATHGYDHNYILNGEHAAQAESEVTGVKMDVFTDMPCLQFYTGGQLGGVNGKSGKYNRWAGFCLEPQFCPDSINKHGFEKPVLNKYEEKSHYIKFNFAWN